MIILKKKILYDWLSQLKIFVLNFKLLVQLHKMYVPVL